jgi:serine/threonine protein kinase
MDPATWQWAKQLIGRVLDRPADEREALLRAECTDPALLVELQRLLATIGSLGGFMETPAAIALAPGTRLDRYEIVARLGGGGMGEVYRARDPRLGRDVALKVMQVSVRGDSDLVRRFDEEARAAGTLNHPNIVAVYDTGVHDGQPYIVSELVDGVPLRELIGRSLPIEQALRLAIDMCDGLAAAHERHIAHCDLKPENLMVTRDSRVKILDFGLARLIEPSPAEGVTVVATRPAVPTGSPVMGTIGYMSPEQLTGRKLDHRTDLFAAGAVLYELVSGRRAFAGGTAADTAAAVLTQDPPDLPDAGPSAAGVLALVRSCLEKDPALRFQSARDLAVALRTIVAVEQARGRTRLHVTSDTNGPGPHRLMVLPFDNVSRQREDEWLAPALADSLTFGLRNLEQILIVSRQQTDAASDPHHIFETLGVRYCVTGSYQRVGDDLKVLARLVEAPTGAIVVQESLTDRFTNLLALQDDIAARFAASFEQTRSVPSPSRTSSLPAYKRLAQARELRLTAHYEDAARQLEIAVRQDETYAEAWALLANSYARLTSPAASDDDARANYQGKAKAAAARAMLLDGQSYDAHIALALVFRGLHDVERWRAAALKASELNPRMAEAFVLLGQSFFAAPTWGLARHRDGDLAERYLRKGVHLDPRFGLGHNALVYHLLWAGRAGEALQAADDALRVLPDHVDLLRARAMTLLNLGRVTEAEDQLVPLATEKTDSVQDEWALAAIDLLRGRAERAAPRLAAVIARGPRSVREIQTALIYCKAGDFAKAAAHLAAGAAADSSCYGFVADCPAFAAYRGEPAIAAVLTGS